MCICILSGPACMLVHIHLFICTLFFSANAWNWVLSAGTSLVSMRAPFSSLHPPGRQVHFDPSGQKKQCVFHPTQWDCWSINCAKRSWHSSKIPVSLLPNSQLIRSFNFRNDTQNYDRDRVECPTTFTAPSDQGDDGWEPESAYWVECSGCCPWSLCSSGDPTKSHVSRPVLYHLAIPSPVLPCFCEHVTA